MLKHKIGRTLIFLLFFACAAGVLIAVPPKMVYAADYYVNNTTGDDSYDGLYETFQGGTSGPLRTLHYAFGGDFFLTSGDVIHVAAGTYSAASESSDTILYINSLSNITIMGAGVDQTIIDGTGASSWVTGVFIQDTSSNIVLSDMTIRNFQTGVNMQNTTGNTIEHCKFYNHTSAAIYSFSSSGAVSNSILGNIIYDSMRGVQLYGMYAEISPLIQNNLIYEETSGEMQEGILISTYDGESYATVYHNTIDGGSGTGATGIDLETSGGSDVLSPDIQYNIITNFTDYGVSGSGTVTPTPTFLEYNNVYGNGVSDYNGLTGTNSISEDPLFSALATHDYHLTADSLCVDAAATSSVAEDLEERIRPLGDDPDMGCYEHEPFVSGNSPPDIPVYVSPASFTVFAPGDPVILEAGPFSDPEGDSHISTRWRIARADREFFEDNPGTAFDWEETGGDLTSYTVPNPEINFIPGMAYMWIVGYRDSGSGEYTWSEDFIEGPYDPDSEENIFVVGARETDNAPPVASGSTAADYRMYSCHHIPDNPEASAIIGDDLLGGYDTTQYKIGTYDPDYNGGSYREYPDFKIYPGGAAWILAREGMQIDITGVPMTVTEDVECPLHYSVQNADGWNMVGPPNDRNYLWSDVMVLVYNQDTGAVDFSARIGDLASGNPYIDTRLWEWENGQYASDTTLMESGNGYWVQVRQQHVNLAFPVSAQATWSNPDVMLALGLDRAKQLAGAVFSQREAIADEDSSPPSPMSSFHASFKDEKSSVDVSCFIESIKQR
ncbi:MAG: right-handed parallel beta-helix repeat-containing protein [Thermodesulfobacteriota bacterium]|nr:right-handed parallel beta-helix repeat-containing protein [Thermodesulfobacteriota bacterium]